MTILNIRNRTENWKTAVHFSPMFDGNGAGLALRLGESPRLGSGDVKLELFWKGMRDLLHQTNVKKDSAQQTFAALYVSLFPDLRRNIEEFGEFQKLQDDNYDVSTAERKANLANNLSNTEIDIVLETQNHLFIGEAKDEMNFGANGNLVLVHQLIRQYVTASILIDYSRNRNRKRIIPFVVGDNVEKMKKDSQVRFMISQGWLKEGNILKWDEIASAIS